MNKIPRKRDGAIPRRRFLDRLLGFSVAGLGAAIVYPVIRFISPPNVPEAAVNRVLAARVSELEANPAKLFPFGNEAGILIRTEDGGYRAFSATCTHLECTVQFHEPTKRIWCACHNGWYDLNGKNVGGPPPRPLDQYSVHLEGDEIYVSRG